jgi:hypothetical protein
MLFGAMFLNPDGINTSLVALAIAITGLIVGFAWIRRITGPDPDKEPTSWRYRQVDRVRWPSNVKLPMPGWIATRLAMAVAAGVLVFAFAPRLVKALGFAIANAPWLWIVAIGLVSAGTLWIIRIARAAPEADAGMDLNEFMAESNAKARRGRALGRMMIFGVLVVLGIAAFLWIAAPNGPQAMFLEEPQPHALVVAVPVVAFLGLVIGLVWMVRISRAHQEPEPKGWRYRDF